ncbi:MAG TPA: histidine phosphatase family protein [Candidatus Eisenbacteria bacterium]|jgi:broad specificity phosphatase PhoE|nr:histidine phosphatase family protein [Candidatus Eisenbacteria bacterium]
MTRLVIIRHAESAFNLQNRIQGHMDSALSPKGRRQARRVGLRIKKMKLKIDKIFSSDLVRAWATTQEIARHMRVPVVRDARLREIFLGAWEGMTPEEVDEKYDKGYQRWLRSPSSCRIPGCETVARFRRRVTRRVRAIARQNRGKTVLLVTHGGVITALLADWLKADFDNILLNLQIDNTSLTLVDETETRVRLRTINDATHLSARDRSGH